MPLTSELATSGYSYNISNSSAPISNLFYMDDLKLYSKNDQEQVGELKIVKHLSADIGIESGLEKCAKASFKKGKLALTGNIDIDEYTAIEELNQEGIYKYLGVDESDGIQHSKMIERIRKEYLRRVRLILRTELNGRIKTEAVNSLAVPVVQYSFGIIDWKILELKKIDTKIRKLLNMHKMLRANVPKNQTFLKYGGNSHKINSFHIHRLDRPWCETNHDILRLAEYRFIYEKIDNNRILSKCRFSCSKFKKNVEASRHKMKQPRPIKTIKS